MDREAWLTERKTGIGSSDAPAIAGLSPWSSALEVYLRKTGQLPAQEMSEPMRWGLKLEEVVAAAYEEETGRVLEKPPPILRHPEHPWMLASLDRVTTDGIIVELKTANAYTAGEWGDAGTDEIPEPYLIQTAHQMAVAELDRADVAVLIGGQDFRIYTVSRNQGLIQRLLEIEGEFWDRVQAHQPPDPDWLNPRTVALLDALYPPSDSEEVSLGDEAAVLLTGYQARGETIKQLEEERREAKARLVGMMGSASLATLPDGSILSRKQITVGTYTVPEATRIDFRVKKPRRKKVSA
jgi:putative phage-type endonuclease